MKLFDWCMVVVFGIAVPILIAQVLVSGFCALYYGNTPIDEAPHVCK